MRLVRAAFAALGLEVRRAPSREPPTPPPPIFEDPAEMLHRVRGGGEAALWCPLEACVSYNGFGYGRRSWHPFVATLRETMASSEPAYRGSVLEAYFEAWQPANAAEALIGAEGAEGLYSLPSAAFLFPWSALEPEERIEAVERIVRSENRDHGNRRLPASAGYNHHGPVSQAKGELEYGRLLACIASLGEVGWDRARGDAAVTMVQREGRTGYLVLHGHHRAAAASALGLERIPARLGIPHAVDRRDASHWPQVRRKRWTEAGAVGYLDHLLDFDARRWAVERGLLTEASQRTPMTPR